MGVDGIRDRFSLGREQDGQLSDKLLTALTILLSLLVFVAEPRLRCMSSQSGPKPKCHDVPDFGRDRMENGQRADIAESTQMSQSVNSPPSNDALRKVYSRVAGRSIQGFRSRLVAKMPQIKTPTTVTPKKMLSPVSTAANSSWLSTSGLGALRLQGCSRSRKTSVRGTTNRWRTFLLSAVVCSG